ncbi:MAG: ABC transporter substrate-binding protein [Candidatus Zixiibacteriota bacterium]
MNFAARNILLIALATLCLSSGAVVAASPTVVILSTDTLTATNRTISGARSVIKEKSDSAVVHTVQLSADPAAISGELQSIRSLKPDLLVTVGSGATQIAKDNFPTLPIVFSSVKYPVISGFVQSVGRPGGHVTGASLDIPVEIQFRYFRQIIPNLKRVGVLYTSNTAKLIAPARVIASAMGLELISLEITTPRDLPRALDSLAACAQGLWSVADQNLFDPQSTKFILLNSLRKGLPFMGFSRYVVESGALFALDFDYKAIGRQAGQLAIEILNGAKPGDIPVTTPDIIWFHYNEKTAKHVQVDIPAELVAVAKEVYR